MKVGNLEIVQIPAGEMKNFSYLLYCPVSRQGLAVDPSLEPQRLLDAIEAHNVKLTWLVNTHGHRDHVAGNGLILEATGAALAAHPLALPKLDRSLADGDVLTVGDTAVEIVHTPGHTPADITLHLPGALLTGDTLFVTKVGRADMAGSDPAALYASLRRLAAFPGETLVFPGHDYGPQPHSTIAFERQHNPYLRCPDLESFLALRMG
ncbi:metal-dependent hydrolase, beta-lactamase superfamily [Syntrophotalea carbinolica DSM 2380]|uniref:Metal-dependent hydrolase, beta-lactamase superfamily n=1 Tax=Syntrophotalea carbinolica (strain DSM 2380 / NBRC 103641 / GraBd1) TaxID=338963 RepID=Q39ZZ6_SYNC1|nr:hydroxyacylglutathione hydrolase family protein [Syntrophotalea carbinolica]ABA90311.1 metal-dependent hydrolase, beta-lactamase superfamily [Syntrophotalea carbinolica DSM 2380]